MPALGLAEFHLLEYSTRFWTYHAEMSEIEEIRPRDLLLYASLPSERAVEQWARVFQILDRESPFCPPRKTSLAHVASRHGLTRLRQAIVEHKGQAAVDVVDSYGRTPLVYAVDRDHEAAAKLLLGQKVDVNTQDWIGESCQRHYMEEYLVDSNVLLSRLEGEWKFGEYPWELGLAVGGYWSPKAASEFVLEHRADIRTQGQTGASPLH